MANIIPVTAKWVQATYPLCYCEAQAGAANAIGGARRDSARTLALHYSDFIPRNTRRYGLS